MNNKIITQLEKKRNEALERTLIMYNECLDQIKEGIEVDKNISLSKMFSSAWKDFSNSIENIRKPEIWNIWIVSTDKKTFEGTNKQIILKNVCIIKVVRNKMMCICVNEDKFKNEEIYTSDDKLFDCLVTFYGPFTKIRLSGTVELFIDKNQLISISFKENKVSIFFKLITATQPVKDKNIDMVLTDLVEFKDYIDPESDTCNNNTNNNTNNNINNNTNDDTDNDTDN